ncbi:unnamed protein product [Pedinophyceae sp. YPF-701]|nr:unnamed protein product [Pedinophyceae sp. YPF-701]
MPFMRFDWAEREPVRLRRLTWTPWLFGAVFAAVSLLPLAVRAAIIGRMTKRAMSARSVEVTARNITWDQGMNSAVLGRSEFVGLDKEPDWAMLQRWGREGRLTSFFAPEDPWAPARFERDMLRLAPAVRCKLLADQVHGFCVVDAMASKVAAETAAVVREHVGGFGPEGDTAAPYETEVGPGRDKPGVVHPGEMEFF